MEQTAPLRFNFPPSNKVRLAPPKTREEHIQDIEDAIKKHNDKPINPQHEESNPPDELFNQDNIANQLKREAVMSRLESKDEALESTRPAFPLPYDQVCSPGLINILVQGKYYVEGKFESSYNGVRLTVFFHKEAGPVLIHLRDGCVEKIIGTDGKPMELTAFQNQYYHKFVI